MFPFCNRLARQALKDLSVELGPYAARKPDGILYKKTIEIMAMYKDEDGEEPTEVSES